MYLLFYALTCCFFASTKPSSLICLGDYPSVIWHPARISLLETFTSPLKPSFFPHSDSFTLCTYHKQCFSYYIGTIAWIRWNYLRARTWFYMSLHPQFYQSSLLTARGENPVLMKNPQGNHDSLTDIFWIDPCPINFSDFNFPVLQTLRPHSCSQNKARILCYPPSWLLSSLYFTVSTQNCLCKGWLTHLQINSCFRDPCFLY